MFPLIAGLCAPHITPMEAAGCAKLSLGKVILEQAKIVWVSTHGERIGNEEGASGTH